jgi:hypothetical protein
VPRRKHDDQKGIRFAIVVLDGETVPGDDSSLWAVIQTSDRRMDDPGAAPLGSFFTSNLPCFALESMLLAMLQRPRQWLGRNCSESDSGRPVVSLWDRNSEHPAEMIVAVFGFLMPLGFWMARPSTDQVRSHDAATPCRASRPAWKSRRTSRRVAQRAVLGPFFERLCTGVRGGLKPRSPWFFVRNQPSYEHRNHRWEAARGGSDIHRQRTCPARVDFLSFLFPIPFCDMSPTPVRGRRRLSTDVSADESLVIRDNSEEAQSDRALRHSQLNKAIPCPAPILRSWPERAGFDRIKPEAGPDPAKPFDPAKPLTPPSPDPAKPWAAASGFTASRQEADHRQSRLDRPIPPDAFIRPASTPVWGLAKIWKSGSYGETRPHS